MIERIDTRSWIARGQDALSQFANWLFFNGDPDQTISARCHQNTAIRSQLGLPVNRRWRLVRFIAEALFWYSGRGKHCLGAFLSDADRNARRAAAFQSGAFQSSAFQAAAADFDLARMYAESDF